MHRSIWPVLFLLGVFLLLFSPEIKNLSSGLLKHGTPEPVVESRPVAIAPSDLGADEKATIDVYERMSQCVVSIKNATLRRDFFSFNIYEMPQGVGSGIIWDNKGHIVTNFHVVYQADRIEVTLANQSSYEAEVIGMAPDFDLAVLKIDAPESALSPVPLGISRELKVGQKVLALGNPFGLDTSLTTGIISALGRTIQSPTRHKIENAIQTDAAINPGNSGGALLDSFGRLIGINTAILSPSGSYSGVGFAVPVDTVNRIVPQLIAKGKLTRAGLGISLVPDNLRLGWGLKGAIIMEVAPDSAAYKAGLQGTRQTLFGKLILGDIIIRVDQKTIHNNDDLITCFETDKKVGDRVEIEFLRDGKPTLTQAVLQEI